ncbi:MAG TPA: hypothetical protein VI007_01700 [bacterium]
MSRFRLILSLAASILLLAAGPSITSAAVSPPTVRIENVTYSGQNPFGPGTRVTVMMRATGGGAATFHLFGVTSDIGMREVRSAGYTGLITMYTGAYVVRPGDAVRNAGLFASLSARGTELIAAGPRTVTIDGRPPQITSRYPLPGARVANARPNIAVEFIDGESGVNPASVRLLVNGANVTARASISDTSVTYNPETPFRPGPVRIELTAGDKVKNTLRVSWAFQITPPSGAISSVTINPATALTTDDVLTVVATGAPGGTASFAIAGVPGSWPMKESATKGVYFGSMVVRGVPPAFNAALQVTLQGEGRTNTVAASVPVTFLPAPPAPPSIAAPGRSVSLDDPGARLIFTGTSRPGFRVLGRIDYEGRGAGFDGNGTLGEFLTVAGADGTWRTSLSQLVPLPAGRLTITVIAIDQADHRSPPATLEITSS